MPSEAPDRGASGPAITSALTDHLDPRAADPRQGGDSGGPRRASPRDPGVNDVLWQGLLRVLRPLIRSPWWLRIGVIYLFSRLVSLLIFVAAARQQGPNPWVGTAPGYLDFIGIWDSEWYRRIFADGYPNVLPRQDNGTVHENAWAFYPLFPLLIRGLAALTGGEWLILAPLVATIAGLAASLMIYRLFRLYASTVTATWGTAFVLFFPISPILQVPYAESLNLAFLAAALYAVCRHRYFLAVPLVLLSDLSRPIGSAFAFFVLLHLLSRLFVHEEAGARPQLRRRIAAGWQQITVRQRWGALCLGFTALVGALAWPIIAWLVTGESTAYTQTETAWRGGPLILFESWFSTATMLFGPLLAPLAVLGLVVGFLLYLNSAAVRRIGLDLRLWCLSYALYLFAVLHPQTSTFRLLLPLFPLALAAAFISRSRAYRGAVLVFFVLLQIVWVVWLWAWAPLPGGGDYPP